MSRSKDQDFLDKLADSLRAQQGSAADPLTNGHGHHTADAVEPTDEMVIEKCRGAANAAKFADLFDHGDVHAHHNGDDSAADLALLSMMKFFTQDATQLERLFSASALGQRAKWRDRHDYRRRTIERALKGTGETYEWGYKNGRRLLSSSSPPLGVSDDDDTNEEDISEVVWFAELGEPKEREFLIESIGVKGYPIVAFGAGGVAKSFAMLSAGITIAGNGAKWLGLQVLEHGYVLYLDFELDVDEQHRRVRDLCAGLGVDVPKRLAYLSGVGISPEKAFSKAREFVDEYKAKAVIIDSMGLAMQGDMERGKDVLAFHGRYINPLRRAGTTPFIVDHEGKLQSGEKHKDKSPFGSAYKAWASRSVLQFELDEYDKENHALNIRVRQTKTNFGPKIEPIGVRFTFGEKKVEITTVPLPDAELIEEDSVPVRDRILTALESESATNADLQGLTGATVGTIRNNLSQLLQEGCVADDGGRPKVYRKVSSSSTPPRKSGDDDTKKPDGEGLFEESF
jgi:hypothetical protein